MHLMLNKSFSIFNRAKNDKLTGTQIYKNMEDMYNFENLNEGLMKLSDEESSEDEQSPTWQRHSSYTFSPKQSENNLINLTKLQDSSKLHSSDIRDSRGAGITLSKLIIVFLH